MVALATTALALLALACSGSSTRQSPQHDGGTSGAPATGDGGASSGGADAAGGRGHAGAGGSGPMAGGSGGQGGAGSSAGQGAAPGSGGAAGESSGGLAGSGGAEPLPPLTVWLAGDSTVANGRTPCPAGWGGQFDGLFDDRVTVVNSAVGGRSVRTWLYHVQTMMDSTGECVLDRDDTGEPTLQQRWRSMLDGMKRGDYLFIQFGINDGSRTCDRHVGLEAFQDSYGMMAQAAKERGARPIFVTPVSAIACNGSTARGTRGGYVDATHQAGERYDVPVIDLHALSVELYNELGFCPVPGGDVSASTGGPVGDFFCDDHTHFARSGAARIAELVARALREQGIELAEYLETGRTSPLSTPRAALARTSSRPFSARGRPCTR